MEPLVHSFLEEAGDRVGAGLPEFLRNPVNFLTYGPLNPAGGNDRSALGGVFFYTIRIYIRAARNTPLAEC
jgi:hypothetical protein